MADRHPDQHVQGLADRITQLEAQRARLLERVEQIHIEVGRVDRGLGTVRDRYVAALARASENVVDEAKQTHKDRRRALNAKIKKPGQYIVIAPDGRIRHIGKTSDVDARNIVKVEMICGLCYSVGLGRDLVLNHARDTRGELASALAMLRRFRRDPWAPRSQACEPCLDKARAELRPAKDEVTA